jgi:phosphatidate cytidylyltransferase
MSNTQLRIISAVVLALIVGFCMYMGPTAAHIMVAVIGLLIIEEFSTNFLDVKRTSFTYIFNMITFGGLYWAINFLGYSKEVVNSIVMMALVGNIILLTYLFSSGNFSGLIQTFIKKFPFLMGIVFIIPVATLSFIFHADNWISLVIALIVINFSVDIFAWFFGRMFGKHKLWPAVSPKKTIEGFVGGVISSVILISVYWNYVEKEFELSYILVFVIIACCAQLGDLVQSKLKRQYAIKDSSNLIPGHGGVYDRVDSLLFVSPIFAAWVRHLIV